MGVLSDEELVDRYRALGDTRREEFLDQLFERHRTRVAAWCYRMTGDLDAATDLAQDVFLKAFEHLSSFRRESSLKTWLYRIAINHCINHVKKHSQEFVEVTEYTGSIRPSVHAQMEHEEQRDQFRRMIKHLPPKQKAILELRINEQLSYEEIAKISGRTVSTIKASVFFALGKLRKLAKHV